MTLIYLALCYRLISRYRSVHFWIGVDTPYKTRKINKLELARLADCAEEIRKFVAIRETRSLCAVTDGDGFETF